jgi:hypothetical protein
MRRVGEVPNQDDLFVVEGATESKGAHGGVGWNASNKGE